MHAREPDAGEPHVEPATPDRPQRSAASDQDLWGRAGAGDAQARSELAELASHAARGELSRRGVKGSDLADLVQETQRTTFAFLARNQPAPKDLWTFLKYRAWGVLSDHRKKMRASRLDYRDDLEPVMRQRTAGAAMRDRVRDQEVAAALAECRRRLPAELARVLAMRYDAELDTESIQHRLGVHRNTIHVRVFRALERLRECMGAKGYGGEDLQ